MDIKQKEKGYDEKRVKSALEGVFESALTQILQETDVEVKDIPKWQQQEMDRVVSRMTTLLGEIVRYHATREMLVAHCGDPSYEDWYDAYKDNEHNPYCDGCGNCGVMPGEMRSENTAELDTVLQELSFYFNGEVTNPDWSELRKLCYRMSEATEKHILESYDFHPPEKGSQSTGSGSEVSIYDWVRF